MACWGKMGGILDPDKKRKKKKRKKEKKLHRATYSIPQVETAPKVLEESVA